MKIEKLNDHQIRCTLTKEDLAMRHINLSELAYGTEKTKALFQDMMTQASIDFGFEAEDIPLMIEAIPLSPEKIVLIITKVESPDELDTRFSNFTHWEEEGDEDSDFAEDSMPHPEDISSELLELLDQLQKKHTSKQEAASGNSDTAVPANQIRLFTFEDMNDAIEASYLISGLYRGDNTLYKDTVSNQYQLILHQEPHSLSEFNKIIHTMSSYLEKKNCTSSIEAYCVEHCRMIIPNHAVQTLARIR